MYTILFESPAEKAFRKLDRSIQKRVVEKIEQLQHNPQLGKPLGSELSGMWSLRIGKFRVLYTIDSGKLVILVLEIEHRKRAYRKS